MRLAAFVERALEPANQRIDFLLRGLQHAGRRHLAPAQFAHDFLEDLGVLGHGLGAKLVQKEITGGNALVVAAEAVELNGGPLRFGTLRDLVRGLGEDLGVGRNDTNGTRNTDKPSSEFHISHRLARFIWDFQVNTEYEAHRSDFPGFPEGRFVLVAGRLQSEPELALKMNNG